MIIIQIEADKLSELIEIAVRKVLGEKQTLINNPLEDLMTIREASEFIHRTPGAIYGMIYRRLIPYSKCGKRLAFSRASLIKWVDDNRQPTSEEIKLSAREQLARTIK